MKKGVKIVMVVKYVSTSFLRANSYVDDEILTTYAEDIIVEKKSQRDLKLNLTPISRIKDSN